FLDVNDAAVEKYGYSRSEFLSMTLEDIRLQEDAPRLREALRVLKPNDRMIGLWRHRKKDGTTFDVEVLSSEVTILTRRARLAPINGVTQRMRNDRHRATEIAATRALIDATSFFEAAPRVLAAICEAEEWVLGEVWLYDSVASVLRLDGSWHAPDLQDVRGVERANAGGMTRPGLGLVGRVWSHDAPVWIRDLREEPELGRTELTDQLGLRSAVGFPIRARSGVEAVVVLFSQTIRDDPGRGGPGPHEGGGRPSRAHVDRISRPGEPTDDHHDPRRHHGVRRGPGIPGATRFDRAELRRCDLREDARGGNHELERGRGTPLRIRGGRGDRPE